MTRICVLGFDALDPRLVEKFDLKNLKQEEYGKTDISEFNRVATPIIWGSAITGKNIEDEFTKEEGSPTIRSILRSPYRLIKRISPKLAVSSRKFFKRIGVLTKVRGSFFKVNVRTELDKSTIFDREGSVPINIPSYNWKNMPNFGMDDYFEERVDEDEYVEDLWKHFEISKEKLLSNLDKKFVMAWFSPADRMGHIWRGDEEKMRETYERLDSLAERVRREFDGLVLIVSDHGMNEVDGFGDHTDIDFGYWSSSKELGLKNPRFVNFRSIVEDLFDDKFDPDVYSQSERGSSDRGVERKHTDGEKEIKERLRKLGYFD